MCIREATLNGRNEPGQRVPCIGAELARIKTEGREEKKMENYAALILRHGVGWTKGARRRKFPKLDRPLLNLIRTGRREGTREKEKKKRANGRSTGSARSVLPVDKVRHVKGWLFPIFCLSQNTLIHMTSHSGPPEQCRQQGTGPFWGQGNAHRHIPRRICK